MEIGTTLSSKERAARGSAPALPPVPHTRYTGHDHLHAPGVSVRALTVPRICSAQCSVLRTCRCRSRCGRKHVLEILIWHGSPAESACQGAVIRDRRCTRDRNALPCPNAFQPRPRPGDMAAPAALRPRYSNCGKWSREQAKRPLPTHLSAHVDPSASISEAVPPSLRSCPSPPLLVQNPSKIPLSSSSHIHRRALRSVPSSRAA
jgi:hypothetical protein